MFISFFSFGKFLMFWEFNSIELRTQRYSLSSITYQGTHPHFRFRIIFIHLLPCVALVILNCLLYSGMRKAEERKARLKTGSAGKVALKCMGSVDSQQSRRDCLTSFCSADIRYAKLVIFGCFHFSHTNHTFYLLTFFTFLYLLHLLILFMILS